MHFSICIILFSEEWRSNLRRFSRSSTAFFAAASACDSRKEGIVEGAKNVNNHEKEKSRETERKREDTCFWSLMLRSSRRSLSLAPLSPPSESRTTSFSALLRRSAVRVKASWRSFSVSVK